MRDILVALCGLTPQVVTETIWALGRRVPPIHPAEIWILTTDRGRQVCESLLLGPNGALAAYAREYGLGRRRPRCGQETIVVLRRASGAPLEDVRTEQDNRAIADHMADLVRRQTERPETRVHCSVAGGRKTMGILLANALQLYGRPDDRLYHVLVSPDFEAHQDFFYPSLRPRILRVGDGRRLDARHAGVELAEVPYVRLRNLLPPDTLTGRFTMTDLVAQAERELRALTSPDPVIMEPTRNRLRIGSVTVGLLPSAMRMYTGLARIKTKHCVEPRRPVCGECMACYQPIASDTWDAARTRLEALFPRAQPLPPTVEAFRALVSKINRALARSLGSVRMGQRYGITSTGVRNAMAYGLAVDKGLIREQ